MELDIRFKLIVLCVFFVSLLSCKKAEDRTCFKSTGEYGELALDFEYLSKLELNDAIKYVLIQDSLNQIVVKGGKNLIKHIDFSRNNEGFLVIKNQNKCNALRKLSNEITVEIHLSELNQLAINSNDSIVNRGVLNSSYLNIYIDNSTSSISLNVNVDTLGTYALKGFSDIQYRGEAKICENNINDATSMNLLSLTTSYYIYIQSNTSQNIYVNAENIPLLGKIFSHGNVFYRGTPSHLDYKIIRGNGNFIQIP